MIDIKKKYRYRHTDQDNELRRVVVTDGAKPGYPVVTESISGTLRYHDSNGRAEFGDTCVDLIEVGPYDHIQDGDIVEIDMGKGGKLLRRFARITKDGSIRFYSDGGGYEGSLSLSWKDATVRLVCRKENEEKP